MIAECLFYYMVEQMTLVKAKWLGMAAWVKEDYAQGTFSYTVVDF